LGAVVAFYITNTIDYLPLSCHSHNWVSADSL